MREVLSKGLVLLQRHMPLLCTIVGSPGLCVSMTTHPKQFSLSQHQYPQHAPDKIALAKDQQVSFPTEGFMRFPRAKWPKALLI